MNNSIDVFINQETSEQSLARFPQPQPIFQETQQRQTLAAIKLGLRLPSYLKQLSNIEEGRSDYHVQCTRIKQQSPSKIKLAVLEAQRCLKTGEYQRIVNLLGSLIDEGVQHSDVYYLNGEGRRLLGDFELAENSLLRCLSMRAYSPLAYYSLAKIKETAQNFQEAIRLYRHFLTINEHVEANFALGKIFLKLKNYEEAIYHLTRSIKLNSNQDPAVYIMRAEAYEKLQMDDLARADYKEVLSIKPDFCRPYINFAEQLESSGDVLQAFNIRMFVNKLFSQTKKSKQYPYNGQSLSIIQSMSGDIVNILYFIVQIYKFILDQFNFIFQLQYVFSLAQLFLIHP